MLYVQDAFSSFALRGSYGIRVQLPGSSTRRCASAAFDEARLRKVIKDAGIRAD